MDLGVQLHPYESVSSMTRMVGAGSVWKGLRYAPRGSTIMLRTGDRWVVRYRVVRKEWRRETKRPAHYIPGPSSLQHCPVPHRLRYLCIPRVLSLACAARQD